MTKANTEITKYSKAGVHKSFNFFGKAAIINYKQKIKFYKAVALKVDKLGVFGNCPFQGIGLVGAL